MLDFYVFAHIWGVAQHRYKDHKPRPDGVEHARVKALIVIGEHGSGALIPRSGDTDQWQTEVLLQVLLNVL